jgi:outer membrane protein OmpA-like peptidoglycan-associated protein
MKQLASLAVIASLTFGTASCATKAQTGTAIGAGAGAVAGAIIGKYAGNTAAGAIVGAAVGGATGAIIGGYMDRQAAEMERDLEGAQIERVGEGIKITFGSGILFDVDRADLKLASQEDLRDLAAILIKYPDTDVLVQGHTDATGAADYNQGLSERRAQSVANYLEVRQVDALRFYVVGYGEEQPDKLKEAAERQAARGD